MLPRLLVVICCVIATPGSEVAIASPAPQERARALVNAASQPADSGPWEIEIHGGAMGGSSPTGGVASLPEDRAPFVVLGQSIPTSPSWFFGSAARRLNQAFPVLGGFQAVDAVLTTASARRENGGALGFKVSRRMARRLRAEVSVDQSLGRMVLNREALERVETSRGTFVTLFRALPFIKSANATTSIRDRAGREIVSTASLAIDLIERGRVVPFATLGAGMISRIGDTPGLTLRGEYIEGPRFVSSFGIAQSDTLEIRYTVADHSLVAVAGGGIRYALSRRWMARLEARGYFGKNGLKVTLDANPTTQATVPGTIGGSAVVFFGPAGETIRFQFSTDPSAPQSLRGPALQEVVTFAGTGVQSRVSITAGLGWRF